MRFTNEVARLLGRPGARLSWASVFCVLAVPAAGLAQASAPTAAPVANPVAAAHQMEYRGLKAVLLRSAEQMPEEKYGFKPAETVRTFGQLLGHAADSQYAFCSNALGEKNPLPRVEKTKTTKAELVAALKEAGAYCDRAYVGLTDASGAETVKHFGRDMPRIGVLSANNLHLAEHYGNAVTYLRMNGLVPPTSDPEVMKELMK